MDVCVLHNTPGPQDITSISESTDPPDSAHYSASDLPVNDLETCLTEFLSIEDVAISSCGFTPTPEKYVIGNVVSIDEYKDPDIRELSIPASENCLSKCATIPPLGEHKFSNVELVDRKEKHGDYITPKVSLPNGYAKSVDQFYSLSISLPTLADSYAGGTTGDKSPALILQVAFSGRNSRNTLHVIIVVELVSAMKVSREKQGIPPKELSVTWDPDVYDPVPTAMSHVSSNKNHRHRSECKRYGKNKQKGSGKPSRGSKGKDKKQGRKYSGSSNRFFVSG